MRKRKPASSWKKVMTAREIMAELSKNDWELTRIKGSHYIFVKNGESVIVPFSCAISALQNNSMTMEIIAYRSVPEI